MRLRVTLVLLAVLIGGMCIGRRDTSAWPVATWPVYDDQRHWTPPATKSELEVRVRLDDGEVTALRNEDLVEYGRVPIASRALEGARAHRDDRAFLASLVDAATGETVDVYELWEITWAVDVEEVPPLDEDDPIREALVARFDREGRAVTG